MFFFLNLRFLKLTFLLYDRFLVSKLLMLEDSKTKGLQFVNFFIGSFVITSESLSLFKVLSPSLIFTWTAVTNNAFETCKNASYCFARKYETWRQYPEKWEALTCKHKISDKIFANYSPYYHIKLASHSSIGKNEDKVGNNKNRHKKVARKKDGKNLQKNPSSPNFGLRACAN